jgi:hypothetical protein
MAPDGLHLSPAGNRALFDALMRAVAARAGQLAAGAMRRQCPIYSEVNARDPAETFDRLFGYRVNRGVAPLPAAGGAEKGSRGLELPAAGGRGRSAESARRPAGRPAGVRRVAAAAAAAAAEAPNK